MNDFLSIHSAHILPWMEIWQHSPALKQQPVVEESGLLVEVVAFYHVSGITQNGPLKKKMFNIKSRSETAHSLI